MNLLNNETPILISSKLAMNIGLNEALMLQQLYDLVQTSESVKEGEKWVSKTLMEWHHQFPFWSKSTIDRILKKLEQLNLIEVGNFNERKTDRTKWYRINEEELKKNLHQGFSKNDELKNSPQKIDQTDTSTSQNGLCQNDELDTSTCRFPFRQFGGMGHVKMTGAIPRDYTENTNKDYNRDCTNPLRRIAIKKLNLIKIKIGKTRILFGKTHKCRDFKLITAKFVT
ncbi:hypothetical protein ACIQ34_10075 [Ureibacillus sp. NPDC094379]